MALGIDAGAMPNPAVEQENAAGRRLDLHRHFPRRRLHLVLGGPAVASRHHPGAAPRRREVVEQPEEIAVGRKVHGRRNAALVAMQLLGLGGLAVEYAAVDAGDEEVLAEHRPDELVDLRPLDEFKDFLALVLHVRHELLRPRGVQRREIAERAFGGRLAPQLLPQGVNFRIGENVGQPAQSILGNVALRLVDVRRVVRKRQCDRRVYYRRRFVAGLPVRGPIRRQGYLHDCLAFSVTTPASCPRIICLERLHA